MIKENDKIIDILVEYPFLKEKLIKRNRVLENLNNPFIFNTVAKFARLTDVAKASSEKLNELLAFINTEINNAKQS